MLDSAAMRRLSFALVPVLALPLLAACPGEGNLGGDPTPAPGDECDDVYYPDVDGDGLGDPGFPVELCEETDGYVANGDDAEPDCATNDTDSCGVCGGGDANLDCAGVCFGTAYVDGCSDCVGGTTGETPAWPDDWDGDGRPDVCDQCPATPQDRMLLQWTGVAPYAGGGGPYDVTVELLADSGEILLRYGNLLPWEASATVGLQRDAEVGQTLAINDSWPLENANTLLSWDGAEEYDVIAVDAPLWGWDSLHHAGDAHPLGDDEDATIALPFGFSFYGVGYDELRISSNGLLALGEGQMPDYNNSPLPNGMDVALFAALWDDLNPEAGGEVRSLYVPADECARDCAGVWGGHAALDGCGQCSGGTTGVRPGDTIDCNGDCGGTAYEDDCGLCVGGNTGLEPSDPESCPNLPDFTPSAEYMGDTISIDYVDVEENDCLIDEGCVNGTGTRKVLRFGTQVGNIGYAFHLGVPPGPNFHWDECHGHYHYEEYADYLLLDPLTGDPAALGHKNGFCLLDSGVFDQDIVDAIGTNCDTYNCSNQGIGAGCMDIYGANLSCQWIDITDTPDGTYDVVVELNPGRTIEELTYDNNTATVTVEVIGDSVTLIE